MPVVGNSQQPAVGNLHDGRNAVIMAGSDIGVKHRDGYRIRLVARRSGYPFAQNHLDHLVGVGNVYLTVTVHVAVDALRTGRLREQRPQQQCTCL